MSGSSATRRPAQKKRSRSTGGSLRSTTRARTRHRLHGHRTGPFVGLLTLVTILCLGGLVMVLSASSVAALDDLGDSYYFFKRQLLWLVIGAVAMVATMRLDYRTWRRFALPIAIIAVIALLLVLIPQIGISVNGSRRWLGAGPLRFQPSELAKLAEQIDRQLGTNNIEYKSKRKSNRLGRIQARQLPDNSLAQRDQQ
ncbi:MAG: FtsW/RodA/SpoVE family cell cycle protein, partial [Acidimicrobiales bacterium]